MLMRLSAFLFLGTFIPAILCAQTAKTNSTDESQQQLFGWVEKVAIYPGGVVLDGKLDTGADHCSLHAKKVKKFKRNGKTWVKFKIKNRDGIQQTFELPTYRRARIKSKGGDSQTRHVVRLGLCLGGHYREVDVNLVDRSNFSLPVLIGRSFLAGEALVDSSKTYTTNPSCSEVEE
ncbi:MAG: RimK/LysX family protein [bacterium]|nr:RimK/LysX family protein [bacterium]